MKWTDDICDGGAANLHLNIVSPKYDSQVHDLIEPFVYEWTSKQGGSISAEHGVLESSTTTKQT